MFKWLASLFIILICFVSGNALSNDTTKQAVQAVEVSEGDPWTGKSFYRIYFTGPYIVYQNQPRAIPPTSL